MMPEGVAGGQPLDPDIGNRAFVGRDLFQNLMTRPPFAERPGPQLRIGARGKEKPSHGMSMRLSGEGRQSYKISPSVAVFLMS